MSLVAVKAFFRRLLVALIGPSRAVLGMVTFLIGFLSGAGNEVTHYLQTTGAPDLVDLVAAVAVSAWVGVAVFCVGFALLWASRRIDPNGPVRASKTPARTPARKRSVAR